MPMSNSTTATNATFGAAGGSHGGVHHHQRAFHLHDATSALSEDYLRLGNAFVQYHRDPTNVFLHFVTTPLGFVGAVSLLRHVTNSSSAAVSLVGLYLLSLLPIVPNGDFYGTLLFCGAIVLVSRQLKMGLVTSLALVVLAYLLQDLSHLGTGEATFQSTYSDGGHVKLSARWLWDILEHGYYLLPLCVHMALPFVSFPFPSWIKDVLSAPIPLQMQQLHAWGWLLTPLIVFALGSYCLDSKNSFCFFPGTPYFHRVLRCNLAQDGEEAEARARRDDLASIRAWAMSLNPSEDKSTHWWYADLAPGPRAAFDRCANAAEVYRMFRSLFSSTNYCVDVVQGMNEVYVTGPMRKSEGNNSDNIFYTRHVDGPWGLIPFVSVYRCIVGMDRNMMITTHFPLANLDVNACMGDVLAFDFNREVHYISKDESKRADSDEFRVTLKLHYCVYPRVLAPLGWLMHWLNVQYNRAFRALFLKTIKPSSAVEHFLAWNVTFNTDLFNGIEMYFGQRNVLYLSLVGALWYVTGYYEAFFALTSFVHYIRYITTFYIRRGIDFGSFKRDVLLFKTIALVQVRTGCKLLMWWCGGHLMVSPLLLSPPAALLLLPVPSEEHVCVGSGVRGHDCQRLRGVDPGHQRAWRGPHVLCRRAGSGAAQVDRPVPLRLHPPPHDCEPDLGAVGVLQGRAFPCRGPVRGTSACGALHGAHAPGAFRYLQAVPVVIVVVVVAGRRRRGGKAAAARAAAGDVQVLLRVPREGEAGIIVRAGRTRRRDRATAAEAAAMRL